MKQRAYIVLNKSDFADPAVWYALLDDLQIPYGEGAINWHPGPDTIELWTAKVEAEISD